MTDPKPLTMTPGHLAGIRELGTEYERTDIWI